eukprot:CAMPEP_0184488078 /NCGR_PEP_ID=MMETSP0113_2-20130426/10512_1 /TAXON_ID=91329 /ORGANISM="Norrisiella sphaerica, Strain BC52" /LENGTH=126 /DNA_ID=CAMNT_0026870553 /DNA_START=996 /DNA_END=1377 /DNA_ORIENTATION=+
MEFVGQWTSGWSAAYAPLLRDPRNPSLSSRTHPPVVRTYRTTNAPPDARTLKVMLSATYRKQADADADTGDNDDVRTTRATSMLGTPAKGRSTRRKAPVPQLEEGYMTVTGSLSVVKCDADMSLGR